MIKDTVEILRRQINDDVLRTLLEPSLTLAAGQLESADGLLIVLSDPKRVATIFLDAGVPGLLKKRVERCARWSRAAFPTWDMKSALPIISAFVELFGVEPGEKTSALDTDAIDKMVGALFVVMPSGAISKVSHVVETAAREGWCIVLIGLIGEGDNGEPGTFSGIWPLKFALGSDDGGRDSVYLDKIAA